MTLQKIKVPIDESILLESSLEPIPNSVIHEKDLEKRLQQDQSSPSYPDFSLYPDRIILTTYPNQTGIHPIPMHWGHSDPQIRGPIVVSRAGTNMKIRNAIGASSGSYCIYHALAVAMKAIPVNHSPDYRNTEPPFSIGPHPSWSDPKKIVSLDPFGHLAPQHYKKYLDEGVDVRPTASATKAHIVVPEIQTLIEQGKIPIDGHIVLNKEGELAVCKAAVEPAWYLPGVAERFQVPETTLRRALL
jgi:hypothetical protein